MHRRARREFVQLHTELDHDPRVGGSLGIERGHHYVDCDHGWHNGYNAWVFGFAVWVGFLLA
jgi:hypothetical protein